MASLPPHNAYGAHIASDLEWVIFSPSLLKKEITPNLALHAQSRKIVEDAQRNPENLLNFIKTMKRQNLGTYFEHLVFYWLECLDDVHVIGTNMQIFSGKETIGEIDVLFDYKNQVYHWELSVKFYANIGSGFVEDKWVGPLKKDNLERKLSRLFNHQLPLCHSEYATNLLTTLKSNDVKSYPFVKGMLFDHAEKRHKTSHLPKRISTKCLLSFWCMLDDLPLQLTAQTSHYCALSKQHWISTLNKNDWIQRNSEDQILLDLKSIIDRNSLPVIVALAKTKNQKILETQRIFVMPNDWCEPVSL